LEIISGLLSSCCTWQIVLNYFLVGTAGFSVLQSYRPLFLGITFGLLGIRIWREHKRGTLFSRTSLSILSFVIILSLLPELLQHVRKIPNQTHSCH